MAHGSRDEIAAAALEVTTKSSNADAIQIGPTDASSGRLLTR